MTNLKIHRHLTGAAEPLQCFTMAICIHNSLLQGGMSPNPGLIYVSSSGPCCRHLSHKRTLLLRNAWWRCVMPNEFLVTSLPLSWWRLLEELQRHLHVPWLQSAGLIPASLGFPCQPASCLHCPSSLHLRQSLLKLLNMTNWVRREAHFI